MKDSNVHEQLEKLFNENKLLKFRLDERGRELTEIVRDEIEYKCFIQTLQDENNDLKNENIHLKMLLMKEWKDSGQKEE